MFFQLLHKNLLFNNPFLVSNGVSTDTKLCNAMTKINHDVITSQSGFVFLTTTSCATNRMFRCFENADASINTRHSICDKKKTKGL